MEFIVAAGDYTQIPYADNLYADDKAKVIADSLLLCQPMYYSGSYDLKWDPDQLFANFGTKLAPPTSSCFDRIEISVGTDAIMQVTDFTAERQRATFEPERELDRRSLQNSLFPGQQELRQQAQDQRRFNSVLRKTPRDLFALFRKLLRGEVDANLFPVKFLDGVSPGLPSTLPAGTPLVRTAAASAVTPPGDVTAADNVFVGVVKRQNEPTGGQLYVQNAGETLARVMGPVTANDPIGLSSTGGTDFATNGAYFANGTEPSVGIALETIADPVVKLVKVRLGSGGGGKVQLKIRGEYSPMISYALYDMVIISTGASAGTYVCILDATIDIHPSTGAPNWMQLPMGTVGAWL